jgi:TolB-like protein
MDEPKSSDQQFIDKLTDVVLANLSRENFDVEELAREARMSRSSIHRKLKHLKRQNASQFIREIRLQKAMEMLQLGLGTASEIAYKVGFGSPAYFTKCFHEYFGYPPGEARKRIQGQETDHLNDTVPEPITRKKVLALGLTLRHLIISAIVIVVIVPSVFMVLRDRHEQISKKKSIVVLPFKNLTGDVGNQYFADGIMEDILNSLYHVTDLRVISRTTSEHFRDTDFTSGDISKQVDARNVLEGSIRRQDNKIRISVQLIDARRDQHLWSENYDRELTDMLGIQGEIALQVANKLNALISETEKRNIRKIPTGNPEAYDFYLRGRFLLHRSVNEQRTDIDRDGLIGSINYLEMAVAADTNFAEAYAGMAQAWFDLSAWGWLPIREGFPKARELSMKAIELKPECAEAHTVLGAYHCWGDRNFEEARTELIKALELKPDYPIANQYYAQLLMITGPIEETRTFLDHALELEPHFWVLHNLNAYVYYFEGRNIEALEACKTAKDLNSNYFFTDWLFFLNYARLKDAERASEALIKIVNTAPVSGNYTGEISEAYRTSGIKGLFLWMIDTNINRPIPVMGLDGHPFFISWWYAIIGDRENTIYWLERNMEQKLKRHAFFDLIVSNPDFGIMRGDPRFEAIVDKIGLTSYNTRPDR